MTEVKDRRPFWFIDNRATVTRDEIRQYFPGAYAVQITLGFWLVTLPGYDFDVQNFLDKLNTIAGGYTVFDLHKGIETITIDAEADHADRIPRSAFDYISGTFGAP